MPAHAAPAEMDSGPHRTGVARLCVVSREVRPVEELIRFVIAPDGGIAPDVKRKLPGRGVWVTAAQAVLVEAVKRRAFSRGFKCEVKVDPDLVARTELLLERAALDALAIAGKAGEVVCGAAKVEHAIAVDRSMALIHARDAAADGVRKLDAALRRSDGPWAAKAVTVRSFTAAQLDLALGRTNVVHAALLAGTASSTFLVRWARLEGFRSGDPGLRNGARAAHLGRLENKDRND